MVNLGAYFTFKTQEYSHIPWNNIIVFNFNSIFQKKMLFQWFFYMQVFKMKPTLLIYFLENRRIHLSSSYLMRIYSLQVMWNTWYLFVSFYTLTIYKSISQFLQQTNFTEWWPNHVKKIQHWTTVNIFNFAGIFSANHRCLQN